MEKVKVIQVIETVEAVGNGTEQDPYRLLTCYWDFDGELLAEKDIRLQLNAETIETAFKNIWKHS